jgi:hypothetical protein
MPLDLIRLARQRSQTPAGLTLVAHRHARVRNETIIDRDHGRFRELGIFWLDPLR